MRVLVACGSRWVQDPICALFLWLWLASSAYVPCHPNTSWPLSPPHSSAGSSLGSKWCSSIRQGLSEICVKQAGEVCRVEKRMCGVMEKSTTSSHVLYTAEAAWVAPNSSVTLVPVKLDSPFTLLTQQQVSKCPKGSDRLKLSCSTTSQSSLELQYQLGLRSGRCISLGKAKKIVMSEENTAFLCRLFSLRERCFEEKLKLSILSLPQMDVSLLLEF